MKTSAGLLVYRKNGDKLEYLIVHPSGAYNKKAPYYLPKGKVEEKETNEEAAIRETLEETGITGKIEHPLTDVVYTTKTKTIKMFLAQYEKGLVDETGMCPEHDWENDIVKFVSSEYALSILREEFKVVIEEANKILAHSSIG